MMVDHFGIFISRNKCFKQKWETNLQQTIQSFSTLLERASPSRAVHEFFERGDGLYAG